jgi:DNA helicase-2/ATP-dependent DNA helicase PcrA
LDSLASPVPDPLLDPLSDEQRQAVLAPAAPVLVLSGAGSGKTRVLTHRVAYLLRGGVAADRLLLMTFTNAAAREMLARVRGLLGPVDLPEGLWAGTFHHIALRILRQHGGRLGLPPFSILSRPDAAALFAAGLPRRLAGRGAEPLLQLLSVAINTERPLHEVVSARAPGLLEHLPALSRAADEYTRRKVQHGVLDFDDLLLCLRLLLLDHPDLAAHYQEQFHHLLIDEYQDVSPLQAALCDHLAQGRRQLLAVGDDAQAIYGFRGARVDSILSFPMRWPDARVLRLSGNYRSGAEIVALANRCIQRNRKQHKKAMRPLRGAPATRPLLVPLPHGQAQAAYVVRRITELLAQGVRPGAIALLYRSHGDAAEVQAALAASGLPCHLRSAERPSDQVLPELPAEEEGPAAEGVVLSTVHKAKGLEWPVVFVLWLSEGRFPPPAARTAEAIEEERRLFYVAITRARDELYLCCPAGPGQVASRFVRELSGAPIDRWDPAADLTTMET